MVCFFWKVTSHSSFVSLLQLHSFEANGGARWLWNCRGRFQGSYKCAAQLSHIWQTQPVSGVRCCNRMHARAHAACQTRLMRVAIQLNWLIQRCAKQFSACNLEDGAMCSHARTVDSSWLYLCKPFSSAACSPFFCLTCGYDKKPVNG